jgi:hypothetical protein
MSPKISWQARSNQLAVLLAIFSGAIALMWPSFVNKGPFFFSDTTAYIRSADGLFYATTGAKSSWTNEIIQKPTILQTKTHGTKANHESDRIVLSGRSAYYGVFVYITSALGRAFIFTAIFQALISCVVIAISANNLSRCHNRELAPTNLIIILMGVAFLTPLGYFTSFLMPDFLAGISVLAVANFFAFQQWPSRAEKSFMFLVLVLALVSHSANLIITAGLTAIGILTASFKTKKFNIRIALFPLVGLIAGFFGELAFGSTVNAMTGHAPIRPPFLSARLISEGPGANYLAAKCPGAKLLLCEWRNNISSESDGILWGDGTSHQSFAGASANEKRRLSAEDIPFAIAVVVADPEGVVTSSTYAIFDQATMTNLTEFNYDKYSKKTFSEKVPPEVLARLEKSAAFQERMPVKSVESLFLYVLLASLAYCGRRFPSEPPPLQMFMIIAFFGIVLDVVVCGALSTPHDRYFMRIIWIAAMICISLITCGRRRRVRES